MEPAPDPGSDEPTEPAIDCDEARALLPRHAKGALLGIEQARFRAHILRCEDCRAAYRTAIAMTARIGRGLANAKLERTRSRRRADARALPFRVGLFGRSRRSYWLRAVIGTALLITLVTRLPGAIRAPQLAASWQSGGVQAGTKELSRGDRRGPLVTGDWIVTEANGAATVTGFGARAELGAGTALLVEEPRGFRVRFRRGTVTVAGQAVVATEYGFAELDDARVRLVSTLDGIALAVEAGALEWIHPGGAERVEAGWTGSVRLPGPLVAER